MDLEPTDPVRLIVSRTPVCELSEDFWTQSRSTTSGPPHGSHPPPFDEPVTLYDETQQFQVYFSF